MNVAKVNTPSGAPFYLDLDVVNTTAYTPADASRNGLNGRFAQISFSANADVGIRVYVRPSCATADSCEICDDATITPAASRAACYARGCGCYGYRVTTVAECTGLQRTARHDNYKCSQMDAPTSFPGGSLIGFSVYDLNTGVDGKCVERLKLDGYDYYATPLRPTSGNPVASTVEVNLATKTFTGTVPSGVRPSDPNALTDAQATSAVQFFFPSRNGYIDGSFSIACEAGAAGNGGEILFAGSSSLCAPPPPMPPLLPPSPRSSARSSSFADAALVAGCESLQWAPALCTAASLSAAALVEGCTSSR